MKAMVYNILKFKNFTSSQSWVNAKGKSHPYNRISTNKDRMTEESPFLQHHSGNWWRQESLVDANLWFLEREHSHRPQSISQEVTY